jgi:hypothetical protein
MRSLCMIFLTSLLGACQTGVFPISQREYLSEKEGKSPHLGHRRPVEEKSESSPEIYVKRESLAVIPKETQNFTGSLLSLKRAENSLFMEPLRGAVGETLDVLVKVNRSESAATPPAAPAAPMPPAPANAAGKGPQDELIAALPKLEPEDKTPKVPSVIKMRVLRKLENGDVIVEAARASTNEWDANSIRAVSRIPRLRLASNQPLTTLDLVDVDWYEQQGANTIARESSGWEDEYSLRWAGFEEARSKTAIELENKRKDLQKVKDRLQDRIVNMSKERGQIAAERERVRKLREEAEQKLNELNKKVADQNGLIEQQKDTIQKQQALLNEVSSNPEKAQKGAAPEAKKTTPPAEAPQ